MRFPMSKREHRMLSGSSRKRGSKTQCPKFEQYAVITPKQYEIGCQLLLITKAHTGFRLVSTSMTVTLDDLERRN